MATFSVQKQLSGPVDWDQGYAKLDAVSKVPFRAAMDKNEKAVSSSILALVYMLTRVGLSQHPRRLS